MPAVIESLASVLKEFHILASLRCLHLLEPVRTPCRRRPAGATPSPPAQVMVAGTANAAAAAPRARRGRGLRVAEHPSFTGTAETAPGAPPTSSCRPGLTPASASGVAPPAS